MCVCWIGSTVGLGSYNLSLVFFLSIDLFIYTQKRCTNFHSHVLCVALCMHHFLQNHETTRQDRTLILGRIVCPYQRICAEFGRKNSSMVPSSGRIKHQNNHVCVCVCECVCKCASFFRQIAAPATRKKSTYLDWWRADA